MAGKFFYELTRTACFNSIVTYLCEFCLILAQEWCVKKGFELVELDPEVDEYESEQDFFETTGIKRVIQALHAHVWPNLTMKGECILKKLLLILFFYFQF